MKKEMKTKFYENFRNSCSQKTVPFSYIILIFNIGIAV